MEGGKKESGGNGGKSLPVDWLKNRREKAVAEKLREELREAALRAAAVEILNGGERRAAWEDYARAVLRWDLFFKLARDRERGKNGSRGNRFETFFENIEKGRKTEEGEPWGVESVEILRQLGEAFAVVFAGVKFETVLKVIQNIDRAAGFEPFEG